MRPAPASKSASRTPSSASAGTKTTSLRFTAVSSPRMHTRDAAVRWVDAWSAGWNALDAETILAVYADDCLYLSAPFREPTTPREYVEWALAEEESAETWFGEPVVDGDRAAVEWRAFVRENG